MFNQLYNQRGAYLYNSNSPLNPQIINSSIYNNKQRFFSQENPQKGSILNNNTSPNDKPLIGLYGKPIFLQSKKPIQIQHQFDSSLFNNPRETLNSQSFRTPQVKPFFDSGYNIISNSPLNDMNNLTKKNKIGRYENAYNNQKDHVGELLNWNSSQNYINPLNQYNKTIKTYSKTPNPNETHFRQNANFNMDLFSGITENTQPSQQVIEKISSILPEYYEPNCIAIKEYAYKEDPNRKFRNYMEDRGRAVDCLLNNSTQALFCLFDGHGGGEVSKYLQENFIAEFKKVLPSTNIETTMISLFDSIDQKIKQCSFSHVGSTACVVYLTVEDGKRVLYSANIGDTRCVIVSTFGSRRVSYDHRASDQNEYRRIIQGGGIVFNGRVCGMLMLSRAFGDWELKNYGVINTPYINRIEIENVDRYLIIASDGVWDVFSDDDMFNMSFNYDHADIFCKNIIETAMFKGTMDNLSCFVIKLS